MNVSLASFLYLVCTDWRSIWHQTADCISLAWTLFPTKLLHQETLYPKSVVHVMHVSCSLAIALTGLNMKILFLCFPFIVEYSCTFISNNINIYREFPVSWMKRHIEAAGMKVTDSSNFTIMHTEESAMRQVRVAKSKFDLFRDANLRRGMDEYLLDLE